MRGIVVRIFKDKKFGFIKSEVDDKEYFFHRSSFIGHWEDLEYDITKKQVIVEFEVGESARGPRAENVTRVDGGI